MNFSKSKYLPIKYVLFLSFCIPVSLLAQLDVWSEINSNASWEARAGLQAVELNGDFYILGGRTPNPPQIPPIPGDSKIWNDVWKSTDKGISWDNILADNSNGSQWPQRAYFQVVEKNDTMFVIGGQDYQLVFNPFTNSFVSESNFFNDVWASTDGVNWTQLTDSAGWAGRAGLSAVVYNNEIYVMGGSINDDDAIIGGPPARIYYNDVWKSSDGVNWVEVTDSADWSKRAGGIAVTKDSYIYMIGGEVGFLCSPGVQCPPYFNDVWKTQDGISWELVTDSADWSPRPGHQCLVGGDYFFLFGGFGLDTLNPNLPANPIDTWISKDGDKWTKLFSSPWNATSPEEIKYDFDALIEEHGDHVYIYTFGGDRETFDFNDPLNYLNVDNDVWLYCYLNIQSSISESKDDPNISISPNPFSSSLLIESKTSLKEVAIYDLSGKKLYDMNVFINKHRVDVIGLDNLHKGAYVLKIETSKGVFSKRIVK